MHFGIIASGQQSRFLWDWEDHFVVFDVQGWIRDNVSFQEWTFHDSVSVRHHGTVSVWSDWNSWVRHIALWGCGGTSWELIRRHWDVVWACVWDDNIIGINHWGESSVLDEDWQSFDSVEVVQLWFIHVWASEDQGKFIVTYNCFHLCVSVGCWNSDLVVGICIRCHLLELFLTQGIWWNDVCHWCYQNVAPFCKVVSIRSCRCRTMALRSCSIAMMDTALWEDITYFVYVSIRAFAALIATLSCFWLMDSFSTASVVWRTSLFCSCCWDFVWRPKRELKMLPNHESGASPVVKEVMMLAPVVIPATGATHSGTALVCLECSVPFSLLKNSSSVSLS